MSKRIQVTVPDAIAADWENLARAAEMSVSAWIAHHVTRSLADEAMERVTGILTDHDSRITHLERITGVSGEGVSIDE